MKIINLMGGPGAGKSTNAAGLFYEMKMSGYNVELVTEYAKNMVYEDRYNILKDQMYVFAKQCRSIEKLRDKVEWVVTDSPLFLSLLYAREDYWKNFFPLVMEIFDSYDNTNFYIDRKDRFYNQSGRYQTYEEALKVDDKLLNLLSDYSIEYEKVDSYMAFDKIFEKIKEAG